MRKLVLALLAVVMLGGTAFAGSELSIRAGIDPVSSAGSADLKIGFNVGVEWLFDTNDMIKIGPGVQYGFGRGYDSKSGVGDSARVSMLPIYATIELTPFKELKDLFFKGILGFSVDTWYSTVSGSGSTSEMALYIGAGAGYKFAENFFVDAGYYVATHDGNLSRLQINVGYRFTTD